MQETTVENGGFFFYSHISFSYVKMPKIKLLIFSVLCKIEAEERTRRSYCGFVRKQYHFFSR